MGSSTDIPADVGAIEAELARQRRDQASGKPVVRARTLNLLAVSRQDPAPPDVMARLTEAHPCRAISVDFSSGVGDFRAQVSASCTAGAGWGELPGAGRSAFASSCRSREREAGECRDPAARTRSAHVPVVARRTPIGRPVVHQAGGPLRSNRRGFGRKRRSLVGTGRDRTRHIGPGVAWGLDGSGVVTRITPWRELTAQFFDNERCAPYPARVRAVRIVYGSAAHLLSDAVLLAAWIARQLTWRVPALRQTLP